MWSVIRTCNTRNRTRNVLFWSPSVWMKKPEVLFLWNNIIYFVVLTQLLRCQPLVQHMCRHVLLCFIFFFSHNLSWNFSGYLQGIKFKHGAFSVWSIKVNILWFCCRVKPAIFDLFLALGIASYLGMFYLALVVSVFLFLIISMVYDHSLPSIHANLLDFADKCSA